MKSAETCSCSLCNKFYTYLYHHTVTCAYFIDVDDIQSSSHEIASGCQPKTYKRPISTTVLVTPQIVARLTEPTVGVATQTLCGATNALGRVSPLPATRNGLSKHYTRLLFSTTVFVAPQIVARLTEPSVITGVMPCRNASRTAALQTLFGRVSPLPPIRHGYRNIIRIIFHRAIIRCRIFCLLGCYPKI